MNKKKKTIIIVICAVLLAAILTVGVIYFCNKQNTKKEKQISIATCVVPSTQILYKTLNRGDVVNITGELENFYLVDIDGVPVYIEKRLIRLQSEAAFKEYEGTINDTAKVYSTAYLEGKIKDEIKKGEIVKVIDEFGGVKFVSYGNKTGYIMGSISIKTPSDESHNNEYQYYDTYRNYESDTPIDQPSINNVSPKPETSTEGDDGGELDISNLVQNNINTNYQEDSLVAKVASANSQINLKSRSKQQGIILSDATEAYSGFADEGQKFEVVKKDNNSVVVLLDDGKTQVSIPRWAVIVDDEKAFKEYDVYALDGLKGCINYKRGNDKIDIAVGTKLRVIKENDDYIIAKLEDGRVCFIKNNEQEINKISKEKPIEKKEEQKQENNQEESSMQYDSQSYYEEYFYEEPVTEPPTQPQEPATEYNPEWTEEVL